MRTPNCTMTTFILSSLLIITIISFSLSATSGVHVSATMANDAFSVHHRHHHHHHRLVGSSSSSPPRKLHPHYWCLQFPQGRLKPPPEAPPQLEIDPRYGVEKRLVPTGPNPLHN